MIIIIILTLIVLVVIVIVVVISNPGSVGLRLGGRTLLRTF